MNITINWSAGEKLFDTLVGECERKNYPYNKIKPPQLAENMPKNLVWGSIEHARYLFCICYYMRGGIKSDTAFKYLSRVHEREPWLFVPNEFVGANGDMGSRIEQILKEGRLSYYKHIPRFWIFNWQKLHRFWNSDPAQLFVDTTDYVSLCQALIGEGKKDEDSRNGFYGFQEKMVSMLAYFLIHAGIVNRISHPVPVDFHVLRMLVSHNVLVPESGKSGDVSEVRNQSEDDLPLTALQKSARELTQGYCQQKGVDELVLCDALWLYSNYMCSKNLGNISLRGEGHARRTVIVAKEQVWSRMRENTYLSTCGRCLVSDTCEHNIPAAKYYVQGKLVRRGPRPIPPQLFLDLS